MTMLITLPLGLVLMSWLGAKFGARAPLMLFLPIPLIVSHLALLQSGGMAAASGAASATMDSVPMAFSWAIPYFHLSGLLDRWLPDRRLASALTFVGATAIAYGVQQLYEVLWTHLQAPALQLLAVVGVIGVSALLLRLPAAEREVVGAVPTPLSLVGRLLGIIAILFAMVWGFLLPSPVGPILIAVLHAFPRLTFEMAVSTHVTNGVGASRQVLSGLPLGVTGAVVWCYALVWLPALLPAGAAVALALGLTLLWWIGVILGYRAVFGVFRRENGFF